MLRNYITKEVPFKFRGIDFTFALSQGLFSSADVDTGTRLLLKVLSQILDEAAGRPPLRYVLDAGCGCGVIGICAAKAIGAEVKVRAQDRDELARLLTVRNAEKNGVPGSVLEAFTEPLLAGPENIRWDLILTNIPAKAGKPVLEDFVRRSAGLLNPGGRVTMVAVHTLADFFRGQIAAAGAELLREEAGAGHTVFVYGPAADQSGTAETVQTGPGFLARYPFYVRNTADYLLEDIPLRIEAVHGAAGFDEPGGAVFAAAKLIRLIGAEKLMPAGAPPLLIHEPGQGFFPCWLLAFLSRERQAGPPPLVLSGRNVLALEAARHNTASALKAAGSPAPAIIPAADLRLGAANLLNTAGQRFGCIAAFPELLPQSALPKEADQLASLWESLPPLLAGGGIFIAGFSSTDAERFDRKKPAGFSRLGDIKRKGFRALGYKRG